MPAWNPAEPREDFVKAIDISRHDRHPGIDGQDGGALLKVPMFPVRDSVPSGKITTDQPWPRCSLRRSSAGRAPPDRGMGKVLINSSVSIASHFRLKIESAAATTKARKRNRLGSAC